MTETPKKGKRGLILFVILALAVLGGTFQGGRMASGFLSADASGGDSPEAGHDAGQEGEAEPPARIEAGVFPFQRKIDALPMMVSASVTVKPDLTAPDPLKIRSDLYGMIVAISEMPVASRDGPSAENISAAILAIAPQEAPWLDTVRISLPVAR